MLISLNDFRRVLLVLYYCKIWYPRIMVVEDRIYTDHKYIFTYVFQSLLWVVEFDYILDLKVNYPCVSKLINIYKYCIAYEFMIYIA